MSARPLLRVEWRELRRHPARSWLVVALVALPIAALAGGATLLRITQATADERARARIGAADLAVTLERERDLAPVLAAVPGATRTIVVEEEVVRLAPSARGSWAVGLRLPETALAAGGLAEGRLVVTHGRAPDSADEVAVSPTVMAALGRELGDTIALRSASRLTLVGVVVEPEATARPVVLFAPSAPSLRPRAVLVECDDAPARARELRDGGYQVVTRDEVGAPDGFELLVLFVVGGYGMALAALVIGATFAVGLRRRQREIGLLGASGAAPGAVVRGVLASAALLATVGGALGIAVGLLAARLLHPHLDGGNGRLNGPFEWTPGASIGALAIALAAATAAAAPAARAAALLPIRVALSGRRPVATNPRRGLVLAGALVALGVLGLLVGAALAAAGEDAAVGVAVLAGSVAVVAGLALGAPWTLATLARVAAPLPFVWRLAVRDAGRFRARYGPIVAAVLGGMAVSVLVGALATSIGAFSPGGAGAAGAVIRAVLVACLATGLTVVFIATALSAAEAASDRRVLESIGAPPRVIASLLAARAAYLALLGGALAVPAGLAPAAGLLTLANVPLEFHVPWRTIAATVVGLPLLAYAGTRLYVTLDRSPSSEIRPMLKNCLAFLLVLGLTSLAIGVDDAPFERRTIAARDGNTYDAELHTVVVPENRSRPGDETGEIELAVLRVRSRLDDPGPPVFLLAGGPGGPSIEMLERHVVGGGGMFLDLLGGDAVAIDQRGVGLTRPNLDTDSVVTFDLATPGDETTMLERMAEVCRAEAARWRERGVDLDAYTTVESADDIDAVRRALGYDEIALWGESYGTHLAMATIRRHGDHVARAVLIGPEGPDHTFKRPSQTQRGLEALAACVRADPVVGELVPDLVGLTRTVLERLREAPVVVDVDGQPIGIGAFDLQRFLANEVGLVRRRSERLPALLTWMEEGDFDALARHLRDERTSTPLWTAMSWIMDGASGASAERLAAIEAEAGSCLLGDAVNFPFPGIAAAWGAPDLGDAYRGPLVSDVPVLFLTGTLDARTPASNARELMEHLPNAHLITVEHAGHDLNWVQKELRDAWSAFLAGEPIDVTHVEAPPPRFQRP